MIRVAGYCRVSTDREDQANSFEAQQRYFREYISHHPDWTLYEIYADEGISGTGTKNRHQFNRMLQDARDRKFSLVLTKEVSRFSRNILDTIAYTRELRKLGIGVRFLLDGIDTMSPDVELHLSIMASLAQEESRKTSCRVTWGQIRQMEQGIVFGHSLLGYNVKNGRITIDAEGAETVRLIFQKYTLEELSAHRIARLLTDSRRKTLSGNTHWTSQSVLKILRNEKYVGDLVQRKSYTPDFLTHHKKPNRGDIPLIRISDHHEPIISRCLWNLTQARLSERTTSKKDSPGVASVHIFSGKIFCGNCGKPFSARYKYYANGRKLRRWSCRTAVSQGVEGCGIGKLIREDDALQMLNSAICTIQLDRERLVCELINAVAYGRQKERSHSQLQQQLQLAEIEKLKKKKEAALDSYYEKLISREELLTMQKKYESQLRTLRCQLDLQRTVSDPSDPDISECAEAIRSMLSGKSEVHAFHRHMIHSLTVFSDRHLELKLRELNAVFFFREE